MTTSEPVRVAEARHAEVLRLLDGYGSLGASWGTGVHCVKTWAKVLRSIAVRHAPARWVDRPDVWCEHCEHSTPWPCDDVRDVAAAVGVSVDGLGSA